MVETNNCPSCGYPRTFTTGKCARCGYEFPAAGPEAGTIHPEYMIDQPVPFAAQPVEDLMPVAPGLLMCVNHPTAMASARCGHCGVNICSTCDFVVHPRASSDSILNIGRATHICPNCMATQRAPGLPPGMPQQTLPLPGGVMCTRHPDVSALRRCGLCTATMCSTCDFEFPGAFHLCPTCATTPQTALSPKRKKLIGFGYALAGWSTLAIAVLFIAALSGMVDTKEAEAVVDVLAGLFIFVPTLGGTALSVAAMDKRLGNPPIIWGAVLWNGLLLGLWVVLNVVGSLK